MDGYFMGVYKYLHMRKVLQYAISYSEFISIPTNKKFTKAVRYIHDNKSWESCYVLLKILFPCLWAVCLEDSNLVEMGGNYYCSRMSKQCIERKKSDIDYQMLFPDISSPASIWN